MLDSHYDVAALVRATPRVDVLARLAVNRRYRPAPPPYGGSGRPRTHGPAFRLAVPQTHPKPDVHQVHHTAPFDRYYCITTGWLNPAIEKLGWFDWLVRTFKRP